MDLIYSVFRKHTIHSTKSLEPYLSLHKGASQCAVSSQNIVAFTTTTELEDGSGKSWGSHVYVADLNTPWHSHKVSSNKVVITVLEWDLPGEKLLIADTAGNIQLWTFKDHILNDWICLGTAVFAGENILGASFFHNGKKISLVAEKKDNALYNEKFSHLRFAPSVRHFGGRPMEGCLVVSTTGMVGVVVVSKEGGGVSQLVTASDSLGSTRHRITAVDTCYGKNGNFLVAVSPGDACLPVQCYRVSVTHVDDKCGIVSQALPSFFPRSSPMQDAQYTEVVQLKFVVREDADSLVVATNGAGGCIVEVWELREKPQAIHKMFVKPHATPPETYKTVLWQHQSCFTANSPVACVTTSKVSVTTTMPPPCYVTVALKDGTIHCLYRESLKQVAQASLSQSWRLDDAPGCKRSKASACVSHMDSSWLGGALVAVDTQGQLYVFRVVPIEPGGLMTVPYAVTQLEFCLATGLDWWDLLVSLRPSMVDTVCERLTESFQRQPPATQQFHYVRFLNVKTSLYRLTVSGQAKAADLTSLLMLHSVATAFKSLLRPSDLSSHDKGPAESLQAAMSETLTDVDKVLFHLEAKEFTVEPSTLQSLQQLIQWVADLALNLLARLPEQRQTLKNPGYELLRDSKALNTLRELLVVVRIWGLLRQSCLPVFVRSAENLDVLALLFRLLSRLVQSPEPDESLLDECCLLPSQVMIPTLNPAVETTAIASPAFGYQTLPVQLEYGLEPESLHFVPELNAVEGAMQVQQTVDSIRHIYLGKHPLTVKQCSRCGSKAQVHSMSRTAAIRAWDQRWARACRCGGHWQIHSYI